LIAPKDSAGDVSLLYCKTAGTWSDAAATSLKLHIENTFAQIRTANAGSGAGGIYFLTNGSVYVQDLNSYVASSSGSAVASKSTTSSLNFSVYKPIMVAISNTNSNYTSTLNALYNGTYYIVAGVNAIYGTQIVSLNPGNYQLKAGGGTSYIYLIGAYGANDSYANIWR
jgi:ABC-type enterochelin transport system substrate-binding protein